MDKLIDKIRKLMAKANDPSVTEAEAAAFAGKVQQLLLENNLAMADVDTGQEADVKISEQQFDFKKWNSPHRRGLLDTVCRFYMCQVLYWRREKKLKIIGRPQNVEIALSMMDYLLGTVLRLSGQYGKANPGANIIDFRRGAMLRLRQRITEERLAMERRAASPPSGGGANLPVLFVSESGLVDAHIKEQYRVRETKARKVKMGIDAAAGIAAADGISLRPQVGANAGQKAVSARLNPQQRAIMAAILGISNAGMDSTFVGPNATVTPEKVARYYRTNRQISVESAVHEFGRSFFETESMAQMFVDEAQSWWEKLTTVEKARGYRYDAFLDAILTNGEIR